MPNHEGQASGAPIVRLALGWRARDVEQRSTAHVAFPNDDVSAEILEGSPVALVYADPAHAFTLPPGRFLRANQAAGRVFSTEATPHLDALTPEDARSLAESVAGTLARAGWTLAPGAGLGPERAVQEVVQRARSGGVGFGVAHVGTWRVPRGAESWATLPHPVRVLATAWDGPEALVTLRPTRGAGREGDVRLILQVRLEDQRLGYALFEMQDARERRMGGSSSTLKDWDAQPEEMVARRP